MTAPAIARPYTRPSGSWMGYLGLVLMIPSFFHVTVGSLGLLLGWDIGWRYIEFIGDDMGLTYALAVFLTLPGYLLTVAALLRGHRKILFLLGAMTANLLVAALVIFYMLV